MLRFIDKNKKIHRGELRNHWNYREGRKKCFCSRPLTYISVDDLFLFIMSDFCCGGHIIFGFTEFWWFFVGFPSVVNVRLLIWRWHCRFPFWRGLLLAWIEMHLTIKSMLIFLICLSDAILVQQNAIWYS
jgi:hypothetical protein